MFAFAKVILWIALADIHYMFGFKLRGLGRQGTAFSLHQSLNSASSPSAFADVVIIGSGLAGLSCAALLAAKGVNVCVCESHYEIGGCAHEFYYSEDGKSIASDTIKPSEVNNVYKFEAGPSLYSGLSSELSPNPLKHVFQVIDEEPEWITYKIWKGYIPEAPLGFTQSIGSVEFEEILKKYGGPSALSDWRVLAENLRPLTKGVMSLPSVAMRPDLGSLITLGFRYPGPLLDVIKQGEPTQIHHVNTTMR